MDGWMCFPVDEMKLFALWMNTNFSHERFLTYFIFVDKTFSFHFSFFLSSHGSTKLLIFHFSKYWKNLFSLLVDANEAFCLVDENTLFVDDFHWDQPTSIWVPSQKS
jgi:hypothetical protein